MRVIIGGIVTGMFLPIFRLPDLLQERHLLSFVAFLPLRARLPCFVTVPL